MISHVSLKNFQCWYDASLDFKQITLLLGKNNAGKTAIFRALLLIKQSVEQADNKYLLFRGSTNLKSYKETVYNNDLTKDIGIKIEWAPLSPIVSYIDVNKIEIYQEKIIYSSIWNATNTEINFTSFGAIARETLLSLTKNIIHVSIYNSYKYCVPDFIENAAIALRTLDLLNDKNTITLATIYNFGYGCLYAYYMLGKLFDAPVGSTILIEYPEAMLHPTTQTDLIDILLSIANKKNLQLIIETNSEHIFTRLQRRIAERKQPLATSDNTAAYYFDYNKGKRTITEITFNEYGEVSNWPNEMFGNIIEDVKEMTMQSMKNRKAKESE